MPIKPYAPSYKGPPLPRARMPGKLGDTSHLVVRRDSVCCTVCLGVEPVHAGHGTPMSSLLAAYFGLAKRHPPEKHADPFA